MTEGQSEADLRDELRQLDDQLTDLRQQVADLHDQLGDTAGTGTEDAVGRSQMMTEIEEQQALVDNLEARKQTVSAQLGATEGA